MQKTYTRQVLRQKNYENVKKCVFCHPKSPKYTLNKGFGGNSTQKNHTFIQINDDEKFF